MATIHTTPELPKIIRQTLDRLRAMIHRYVWMQTIVLAAICGLSIFWLTGFVDYFPVLMGSSESPKWARLVMLIGFCGSIGWIIYRMGLRKWSVPWRDSSLALLLERRFPQFRHSLITTIQSKQTKPSLSTVDVLADPQLLAATQQEAVANIEQVDLDEVMHWKPLQWQSGLLGGILALSLLLVLWQPAWTLHWAKRLFSLSNAAWPRMSRLELAGIEIDIPRFAGESETQRYLRPFVDRSISMPRGQSGRLLAIADLTAKKIPETCLLTYRSADSRQGRASLRRLSPQSENRLPFVLEGPPMESIDQPMSLSLQGGDVRIAGLRLDVMDAPQLNEFQFEVRYPEYLRRRTSSLWLDETVAYRTGLRLPQGTDVTVIGRANMSLERCECRITRQTRDGQSISESYMTDGQEDSFRLPIGIIDANWFMEFRVWEVSGHCATRIQQFVLGVLPDEVPQVDLMLAGIGSAITDQAMLPIEAKVTDDHDVAESAIDLYLNENKPLRVPAMANSEGLIRQSIDLRELRDSGQLKAVPGQTLGLTLVAKDYYDLEEEERLGRASPIQLGIVTPNQLLVLLERRELAMRSRMELIISELNQLRELIVKIRQSNSEAVPPNQAKPTENSPDVQTDTLAVEKLQLLRAQQATSQMEKSEGELEGVENEIGQIRKELVNNRIDSQDRQERLENRVRIPIQQVRLGSLLTTLERLRAMDRDFEKGPIDDARISTTLDSLAQTLVALEAILQDMVDIQDFNELVDMVRSMIDDQGTIIDRTKTEQKKRVLDLFK